MPDADKNKNLAPLKPSRPKKLEVDIFTPQPRSAGELYTIRQEFYNSLGGGQPDLVAVFLVMYDYFAENEFRAELIKEYYDTYWLWLVKAGWEIMPQLKEAVFVEIVARTCAYASAQHIPIIAKVAYYLAMEEVADAQKTYEKIKSKLKSLDYPIANNEFGEKIKLAQIMAKLSARKETEDLTRFELFAAIQKALFFGETVVESPEIKQEQIRRVNELIKLLSFFAQAADVQEFINDFYVKDAPPEGREIDEETKALLGANLLRSELAAPAEKEVKSFAEALTKHKTDFADWATKADSLRLLLSHLNQFEDKNQARSQLQELLARALGAAALADMETALAVASVDEFLNKNNYPGDDLIHFDEKSGGFKWGA